MRKKSFGRMVFVLMLSFLLLVSFLPAGAITTAGVRVERGPTDIVNGVCLHENDITVSNEFYKVSFGVGTTPPWGVPRGSILDTALFVNGEWTDNKTALIDFLPNGWSAWPSTYQEVIVAEEGPEKAVIVVKRDYADKVDMITTYTINAGSNILEATTELTNNGGTVYSNLVSGYSLCTLSGYMFGPFGSQVPGYDQVAEDWFGDIVMGYDENWAMALHYPGFTDFAYGTGWRDLYRLTTIEPNQTEVFEAWVQFEPVGSTTEILEFNMDIKEEERGTVGGLVLTATEMIDNPIVIVEKMGDNGQLLLYTWNAGKDGSYQFKLPPGDYLLHATAKGYSLSDKVPIHLEADAVEALNFNIEKGGKVTFNVAEANTGEALDARIEVASGPEIMVGYVGARTFFTDLVQKGKAEFFLAPGEYELNVVHGAHFISHSEKVHVTVVPEGDHALSKDIEVLISPSAMGWYSADLHHHSDILDGVTPPGYLIRSQLAAALDVVTISDHDSLVNNQTAANMAASRNMPFIPSVEVSPNWGHFNVLPVNHSISPAGTAGEIFAAAREQGGLIMANHPYITYGYFYSWENGMVPGGFDADFDLIEINGAIRARDNYRALQRTWNFWSEGSKYYLAGGSDVHDVWLHRSGNARTMAHVDGDFALEKFYASLKAGNTYVTFGPLVFPDQMFGTAVKVPNGKSFDFSFSAYSVNGLKAVTVVSNGSMINSSGVITNYEEKLLLGGALEEQITVNLMPNERTWYALVIEDEQGKIAMTNPIWIVEKGWEKNPKPQPKGDIPTIETPSGNIPRGRAWPFR